MVKTTTTTGNVNKEETLEFIQFIDVTEHLDEGGDELRVSGQSM